MTYGNAYGNIPDDYSGFTDPIGTNGNISVDPGFLDTSASDPADWDFHLSDTSLLIDAGDSAILDPDSTTSDIGAFGGPGAGEWDRDGDGYPEWWQPGEYDDTSYPAEGWDCDDLDETIYPGSGC